MVLYVWQGLDFDDLENIHRWLIRDYDPIEKQGFLLNFMEIVRNAAIFLGVFTDIGKDIQCIGDMVEEENGVIIDVFSIDPDYRMQGLGPRFALTLGLFAIAKSNFFWKKVGFVSDKFIVICMTFKGEIDTDLIPIKD